jgi:hypothetical protein
MNYSRLRNGIPFKPVTPLLWRSLNRIPFFYLELWSKLAFRKSRHVDLWEWMLVLPPLTLGCAICWIINDTSNALLLLFIQSSGLGLIPAVSIATTLYDFRQRGYYDLMSLTPHGAIGASWLIAVRYIRRSNVFFLINYIALLIQITAGIAVLIAALVGIESFFRLLKGELRSADDLLTVFNALMLLLLLRLDYIYAMITAMLVGILTPTETRRRIDSGLAAAAVFMLIQFIVYGIFISGAISLAGDLISNGLLLTLARIGSYIAVRETVVLLLWQIVTLRLNTDTLEFRHLDSF